MQRRRQMQVPETQRQDDVARGEAAGSDQCVFRKASEGQAAGPMRKCPQFHGGITEQARGQGGNNQGDQWAEAEGEEEPRRQKAQGSGAAGDQYVSWEPFFYFKKRIPQVVQCIREAFKQLWPFRSGKLLAT